MEASRNPSYRMALGHAETGWSASLSGKLERPQKWVMSGRNGLLILPEIDLTISTKDLKRNSDTKLDPDLEVLYYDFAEKCLFFWN